VSGAKTIDVTVARFFILLLISSPLAHAQTDRQAIEHYKANFEKYLGKEISLMVARAKREDKGEHGDVAIFSIYTKGQRDAGFTHAVIPRFEAESFARRYAFRDYQTRPVRGTFMATANGKFYISVKGAVFPSDAALESPSEPDKNDGIESLRLPSFDGSPMASFSYDGKRLIEASIIEITKQSVRLADKYNVSVDVPLDRAVKMPDLRMKAKDAMEAAIAQAD
jgi:hypothetical protein